MNEYFENFNDEINQIVSRSKKDKNTTIYRIQKSRIPYIQHKNDEVKESRIESLFGVNLHLLSHEGYIIYGASNRVQVPDVLSRLYQNLENLIKSNKGHKVNKSIKLTNLPTKEISDIIYSDIGDLKIEFLNNFLHELYSEIHSDLLRTIDIEFTLEGDYSLWCIGNSLGGSLEYDEFSLKFKCNLFLKSNPEKKISLSYQVPPIEVRNNLIETSAILRAITFYSKLLTAKIKENAKEKIHPELIILDKNLTSMLFANLIHDNEDKSALSDIIFFEEQELKSETFRNSNELHKYDNFGFNIDTKLIKSENSPKQYKQNRFYQTPIEAYQNLHLTNKDNVSSEYTFDIDNFDSSLKDLKSKLGVNTILFLVGNKEDCVTSNNGKLSLTSTLSIYCREENELEYTNDLTFLRAEQIEKIVLINEKENSLISFIENYSNMNISGFSGSLIKLKDTIQTKVHSKASQKVENQR